MFYQKFYNYKAPFFWKGAELSKSYQEKIILKPRLMTRRAKIFFLKVSVLATC